MAAYELVLPPQTRYLNQHHKTKIANPNSYPDWSQGTHGYTTRRYLLQPHFNSSL